MDYIKINERDNVCVALKDLPKDYSVESAGISFSLKDAIEKGHKFAFKNIASGENVLKYGCPIGRASMNIEQGCHVHSHNLKTGLSGMLDYAYLKKTEEVKTPFPSRKINAYRRKNGSFGIRNELWIIPTVGCVNGVCEQIRDVFLRNEPAEGIDGVFVFPHNYGCSQLGDDHENTRTILQNMAMHPNAGAVLIVGLGCENNQVSAFIDTFSGFDGERMRTLVAQDVEDEITAGYEILKELYSLMINDVREECGIEVLKIGLECGGSDAFSGITANPLLGELSNYVIFHGGTTVLTEVPEMFGAETFLMERSANENVFRKTVHLINDFKEYFIRHDMEIYENPSPGNKKGGITTLEEKSLGAVEKSGRCEVMDVLKYGERLSTPGLNLLSAPGNDLVATTALAAAGCQMVIFTTGRGTPFGGPVPTLKVSTNSELFMKKPGWVDFDAGALVDEKDMNTLLKDLIDLVVSISNGVLTKNETNGFRNLAIFKSGVTL